MDFSVRRPISRRVACLGSILGRVYIGVLKFNVAYFVLVFCWFSTKMVGPHALLFGSNRKPQTTHSKTQTAKPQATNSKQQAASEIDRHPCATIASRASSPCTTGRNPVLQAQDASPTVLVAPIGGSRKEYCAVMNRAPSVRFAGLWMCRTF